MTRMQIGAIALFGAFFLSGCGSEMNKKDLVGYWQFTQSIDSKGKVTKPAEDQRIVGNFTETQIILAQEGGSSSSIDYKLEGKSIINTKTGRVEADIDKLDSKELRLRGGKDSSEELKKSVKVFTRTTEEVYLAITK